MHPRDKTGRNNVYMFLLFCWEDQRDAVISDPLPSLALSLPLNVPNKCDNLASVKIDEGHYCVAAMAQ